MKPEKAPKVMLIIPNLGRGGAQQVFRQQLIDLKKTQFEVIGCVFNWDDAFSDDHLDNIISLDVPAGRTLFQKAFYFIIRILRLRKLKRLQNIEVSISHLEGADYVNILSRRQDKTICWIHGTKRHDENIGGLIGKLRKNLLMPVLYKFADKIVTVSKGLEEEVRTYIKVPDGTLQTIYNGFDVDSITRLRKEQLSIDFLSLFENHITLIAHCRLSRQKNLYALISVFHQVQAHVACKLVIVGDGELRGALISFSDGLGLSTWNRFSNMNFHLNYDVYFAGQQSNPFKFLCKANLFIMTSDWEGFPLSLGEAMACGVTPIAADCFTGPRELIAPDLREAQPVTTPFHTKYGTLMPLADVNSIESMNLWAIEVSKLLKQQNDRNLDSMSRIKEFDHVTSFDQTLAMIKDVAQQIRRKDKPRKIFS